MSDISLSINGTRYLNWGDMTVTRSLERMPWEFEFSAENNWREDNKRQISRGDSVKVKHGNELLLTGYVDDIDAKYDATSHKLVIKGRSKLADLIDCSTFDIKMTKQSLAEIAQQLCKPFDIAVVDNAKLDSPFANKTLAKGQFIWDFLEELARMRAVRLSDSPEGNLVLLNKITEQSVTPLILGKNIVTGDATKSARDLFSEYHVVGSDSAWGESDSEKTAHPAGSVEDSVKRYRPTVVVPAFSVDSDDCETRADLQKRVHRARAETIVYEVNNWVMDDGKTWRPGMLVPVRDDYSGINGWQVIMSTRLIVTGNRKYAEITVMPRYVLDLLPVPDADDLGFGL